VGGIAPLALALMLVFLLPESIRHLVVQGSNSGRIALILRRIDPRAELPRRAQFIIAEERGRGLTVRHLFGEGRGVGTVLIWTVFFTSLLDIFLLTSWLPEVLHDAGFSISASVITTAALQGSGVIGSLAIGPLLDRRGCLLALLPLYVLAGVGIAAIGSVGTALGLIVLASCAAGFGIVAGQNIANAFAAIFYPTYIRATGVGWALGIGRIGAIVGPTVGGIMLSMHWSRAEIFAAGAIPCFVAVLAILGLIRLERGKQLAQGQQPLSVSHRAGMPPRGNRTSK